MIELSGKPVPKLEREPYVLLDVEGGRLSGFGGCNRLGGTVGLDEMTSLIRFAQIVSTRMMCEAGMAIELDLNDALQNADSYTLAGNRLALKRVSFFTPLAQFELMDDPD
ncbi:META domain-containing protein [Nitrosomonas sp.]|uniref:META domain-containing protein n=1 Tax=Nitrosomonas sp. TaxID=42353 RepID=UPI0025F74217|nr:META domain-containing protein [Nitrosomonas sp.]